MAQSVLQALDELARELDIAVLTPEYRILVALLAGGGRGPEELCAISSLSRSGFFHMIDRLKHWQLISCSPDPVDRRRTCYALSPWAAESILGRIRQFRRYTRYPRPNGSRQPGRDSGDDARDAVTAYRPQWRGDRVPNITCEYQVLVFLFAEPGATSGEIAAAMSASPTKFHAALARLVADGLVIRREDGADKRRKRHFLSEKVRMAEERASEAIFAWLEENADPASVESAAPPAPPPRLSAGLGRGR